MIVVEPLLRADWRLPRAAGSRVQRLRCWYDRDLPARSPRCSPGEIRGSGRSSLRSSGVESFHWSVDLMIRARCLVHEGPGDDHELNRELAAGSAPSER